MSKPFGWTLTAIVGVAALTMPAGAQDDSASASGRSEKTITNSIGMKLVRIPAGDFLMGSLDTDPNARDDERPQHPVRINKPFYLGVYEVTQGEFKKVMGRNTSFFTNDGPAKDRLTDYDCDRFPVDGVTWYDTLEFCKRLSETEAEKRAGRVYRLPTEAEWEYACRAGTTTIFSFGNSLSSTQANFNGNYPFGFGKKGPFLSRTTTVGSYKPNAFGLYDMHGSVNEWCADRFDRDYYRVSPVDDPKGPEQGTSPVIRGGDWYSDGRDCRSAFRYADIPEGTFYALGFRVVCGFAADGATITEIPRPGDQPGEPTTETPSGLRPTLAAGEDWPRWRGPRGDGTWRGPQLPTPWPEEGLKRVWRREIGGGYGGIAVFGGRVYVMDRRSEPQEVEQVLCFDAINGKPQWKTSYPVDYADVAYGNGPRATPTVFRGYVYTLGALGELLCLDADNGSLLWRKNLVDQCGARVPIWGLSASPLVFENLLIVHAGAEPNGCYLAFDLRTGEERWRNLPDAAGYATPILVDRGGARQMIGWTPSNVRGLDPRTGAVLWTIPFEVNYGTAIADPLFRDDIALVSSYYDGAKAIRLGAEAGDATVAWQERRNLRALMSPPIYRNGYVYLLDKRHGLSCLELTTGKKLWDDDNRMTPKGRNPQATLVWLNDSDRALVLNSDGDFILTRLGPRGYVEEARANIIGRTWAHPAYAGNCIYARSDTELVCALLPVAE